MAERKYLPPINPETLCAYGESKVHFESHVFIWKIQEFLRLFENVENNLLSPKFEGRKETRWQLRLQGHNVGSETFLKVHLYLLELNPDSEFKKTGISVRFCISLLDLKGAVVREPVGGHITCLFKEFNGWSVESFLKLEALRTSENSFLDDGNLVVKCLIRSNYKVIHESCMVEQIRFLKPLPSPLEQVSASFLKLFNNPVLSDLIIKVGRTSLSVHKSILIARCPVFREMFCNKTKPTESMISISSYDADVVQTMLEYIYCGEPTNKKIILSKKSQMLRIGNEYQLPEFLDLCDSLIAESMTIENAFEVLVVSEETKRKDLMNKAIFLINWRKSSISAEMLARMSKTAPQIFQHLYLARPE